MTTPPPTGSDAPLSVDAVSVEAVAALANELFKALPGDVTATSPSPVARGGGASIGSTPTPTGPVAKTEIPQGRSDLPGPAPEQAFYWVGGPERPNATPGELDLLAAQPGSGVPDLGLSGPPTLSAPSVPAGPSAASESASPSRRPGLSTSGPSEADVLGTLPGAGIPDLGLEGPAAPAAAPIESHSFYFLDERRAQSPTVSRDVAGPVEAHPSGGGRAIDVHAVRRDFPILSERVNGKPLIWFDNAATTQKPKVVIDRLTYFYEHENSNIHRAAHELAARATDAYEGARATAARFIGAQAEDIVFVRGTTEAINLVASTWGRKHLGPGDEIVISHLEHHANIVPWQLLRDERGFTIKVIPVDEHGDLLMDAYRQLLSERTKLVSVTQVSNALGTVTPTKEIIDAAHAYGAKVLIDGAQSVAHLPVDVKALGADFFVFSGHKIYGPTGIGVLYGTPEAFADLPPYQGGGNMIADVTLERSIFNPPPGKFEAGTGNIADAVGLGVALDYVTHLGLTNIAAYEHELLHYATPKLLAVPGLTLVGTAREKASVLSFVLDGFEPPEVGAALNKGGIAVRSGHHCAQPILRRYGLEATVRPSLALYNTHEEIDCMVDVLHRLVGQSAR